jgi:phosphoglycolate phosphatase-like HAD superfamily hydrolase
MTILDDYLEIINQDAKRGGFKSALFDFDGTVSLIREGWREVMIPYFVEVLKETPGAEDEESLRICVGDFVDLLTGKQTIYQCIRLDEEVCSRGGSHKDPLEYKNCYHDKLMEKIIYRIEGLKNGSILPQAMIVPGAFDVIKALNKRGLTLYLASGTDEKYVLEESRLLGIDKQFKGGIYGARDDYKLFSKSMVINNIIETHGIKGHELVGFGDGYVEIENIKEAGGFAVGVATDEEKREGVNEWKRERLLKAGADIIIPDFRQVGLLEEYLFEKEGNNAF